MLKTAIGAKRERVIIQSITEPVDAEGNPVQTPSTLATVWARAEFLSGRELEAAQKINTEISVKITVNKRTDVTTKMKLSWKSPVVTAAETYNIHAILPSEDRFDMSLLCSKVE